MDFQCTLSFPIVKIIDLIDAYGGGMTAPKLNKDCQSFCGVLKRMPAIHVFISEDVEILL